MGFVQSSYLRCVYEKEAYPQVVKAVVRELDALKARKTIDTIAFRGSSGAALAYPSAFFLGLSLLHVRKEDGSHSPNKLEGLVGGEGIVILDDFVVNGDTLKTICSKLEDAWLGRIGKKPPIKAVLMYAHGYADDGPNELREREARIRVHSKLLKDAEIVTLPRSSW